MSVRSTPTFVSFVSDGFNATETVAEGNPNFPSDAGKNWLLDLAANIGGAWSVVVTDTSTYPKIDPLHPTVARPGFHWEFTVDITSMGVGNDSDIHIVLHLLGGAAGGNSTTTLRAIGPLGDTPSLSIAPASNNANKTTTWVVYDEYELMFPYVTKPNTTSARFNWFGSPVRSHIPPAARGVGKTTAPITVTGSPVVIPVDRDLTGTLRPGFQKIWVVSTGAVDVVPLLGVSPTTVTAQITSSHPTNAIVGLDPIPVGVASATGAGPNCFYTLHMDGTFVAPPGGLRYDFFSRLLSTTSGNSDPAGTGFITGLRLAATNSTHGFRGTSSIASGFARPSAPTYTYTGDTAHKPTVRVGFADAYGLIDVRDSSGQTFYFGTGPGDPG